LATPGMFAWSFSVFNAGFFINNNKNVVEDDGLSQKLNEIEAILDSNI